MSHIHTQPGQHDFTASAFIARLDGPEPVIMLHQHRKLKQWLQFGGHVELNESPWQAVCREIGEESGYEPGQLRVLQPDIRLTKASNIVLHPQPIALLTHQFGDEPGKHFHNDISFGLVTHQAPLHTIGDNESHTIQSFTRAQIVALPAGVIPENVRDIALAIFDDFLPNWKAQPLPSER